MKTRQPILMVEDDEVDVMTMRRALKDLHIANAFHVAGDGEEGLQVLARIERPAIILLDINMPRMNGLEFLRLIKADQKYARIPVVMLTSSKEESDRFAAFGLSVAGYMIKPADYLQLVSVVRTIDLYWTLSELPPDD